MISLSYEWISMEDSSNPKLVNGENLDVSGTGFYQLAYMFDMVKYVWFKI